jgi:hypothetical protein
MTLMSDTQRPPNAAQLRGDIDKGRTGDKAAGVDPAAAPMETDAEAGGAPPSPPEVAQARRLERRAGDPNPNASDPAKTPDGGQ